MTLESLMAIGTLLANAALVGAIVFVLSYGIFFRWYSTAAGRSIMAFSSSIVAMGLLSLLYREGRDLLFYGWVRLAIMLFVAAAVWGMVYVLWSTRYQDTHVVAEPRTTGPLGFRSSQEIHTVNNNDRIISYIRTGVPAAVGALLAWLISKIPAVADVLAEIDAQLAQAFGGFEVTVTAILTAVSIALVTTGYYALARWLGAKFPVVEKWLLGRSAIPVYLKHGEAATITDSVPVAEDRKADLTFGEEVVISDTHEHSK